MKHRPYIRKWTKEEDAALEMRFRERVPQEQLATEFGRLKTHIAKRLKTLGIVPVKKTLLYIHEEDIDVKSESIQKSVVNDLGDQTENVVYDLGDQTFCKLVSMQSVACDEKYTVKPTGDGPKVRRYQALKRLLGILGRVFRRRVDPIIKIDNAIDGSINVNTAFESFYFVYGIVNANSEVYIGYSNNVWRRIDKHNSDIGARATQYAGPWWPFFIQCVAVQADALAYELYYQRNFTLFAEQNERSIRKVLAHAKVNFKDPVYRRVERNVDPPGFTKKDNWHLPKPAARNLKFRWDAKKNQPAACSKIHKCDAPKCDAPKSQRKVYKIWGNYFY